MVIHFNVDITWRKRCNMSACSHPYDSHYVQLSGGGSVTSDSCHGNMYIICHYSVYCHDNQRWSKYLVVQ